MIPTTLISGSATMGFVPMPAGGLPGTSPADPTAFGRELQRATEPDPAPSQAPAPESTPPRSATEQTRSERSASETAAGPRTAERPAQDPNERPARSEASDDDTTTPEDGEAGHEAEAATPIDLTAFMASLGARLPVQARDATAAAAQRAGRGDDKAARIAKGHDRADGRAASELTARTTEGDTASAASDRLKAASPARVDRGAPTDAAAHEAGRAKADAAGEFRAHLAEARDAHATAPAQARDAAPIDALVATAGTAVASRSETVTTAATTAAPAIAEDHLAAPVGSHEFAQALGARVAVFARDGVEHARLNLHPVEMGPIALQLALDGTQVRVDMTADVAATRQALEQALPTLASALSEAGLTLSGGGVFQQARDSAAEGRPEGTATGHRGRGAVGPTDGTVPADGAPVMRPIRMDGLVDLYA